MLMIELPTATPPLAMIAAYKETDVTIRIRSNLYYSAEYRIAVHPTIRPRSEYEANIRYSPTFNILSYLPVYITMYMSCRTTLYEYRPTGAGPAVSSGSANCHRA